MISGKKATGKHASSSLSTGYDDDENASQDTEEIEEKNFPSKPKSKSKSKAATKCTSSSSAAGEEAEQEEEDAEGGEEKEEQVEEEAEKYAKEDEEEEEEAVSLGVVSADEEEDVMGVVEDHAASTSMKSLLLKRSREGAAVPESVKKTKSTSDGKTAVNAGNSAGKTPGKKGKYTGRMRDTKSNAAAVALSELSTAMKSPAERAHEIVDADAEKHKFSDRQCYDIKKILSSEKAKAVLFIGLNELQRNFWYQDEDFLPKE